LLASIIDGLLTSKPVYSAKPYYQSYYGTALKKPPPLTPPGPTTSRLPASGACQSINRTISDQSQCTRPPDGTTP